MDITVNGRPGANGTNAARLGQNGQDGQYALLAEAIANAVADLQNSAAANGGAGGNGGDAFAGNSGHGGNGGNGGGAGAIATTSLSSASATSAIAEATSGRGGAAGLGGDDGGLAGNGGHAYASATDTNSGGDSTAIASATGAAGGAGINGGHTGGAGGTATALAMAVSTKAVASATATATETGGTGGTAAVGASPSAGAASRLNNAVSGSTNGGALTLTQTAIGGDGAADVDATGLPGAGGLAVSLLSFDDTKSSTQSTTLIGSTNAIGGAGWYGAAAVARTTLTGTGVVEANASATGGAGDPASGTYGGSAVAISAATSAGDATASSTAVGGASGSGNVNDLAYFGGTARARATAVSTGAGTATATVDEVGGAGGAAGWAGTGAIADANNVVSGYTDGGTLVLSQTATGGAGGEGSGPVNRAGVAGNAFSILAFDDTTSVTQSATVNGQVTANGGAGGAGITGTAPAAGGGATAQLTLTGSGTVLAASTANGGAGGTTDGVSGAGPGQGGNATATTTATGAAVTASATANAGLGGDFGGVASAIVNVSGASGTFSAAAQSPLLTGQIVQAASAATSGVVQGDSTGAAHVDLFTSPLAFVTGSQGIAYETAAPDSASSAAVLGANASISAAFGAEPSFFAIGELGGAYSSAGATSQTVTSSISETVDLTQLATRGDLILGLYDGAAIGAGFTSMTFDLMADGVDVADKTFTSVSAAETYFTDDAIDLGSLASGQTLGADTLSLTATLTITTDATGSGFYGDLIIGDPPAAANVGGRQRFVAAMAGLGASGPAPAHAPEEAWRSSAPTLAVRAQIA